MCLPARSRSVFPGEGGGGGGGSGSPRSSKPMDRPLKEGWLKKQQRGLVKNWQQRYFVLRGTTLTYHKDKEAGVQVSHRSVHLEEGGASTWQTEADYRERSK